MASPIATVVLIDGIAEQEAVIIQALRRATPRLVFVGMNSDSIGDMGLQYPRQPKLVLIDVESWPGSPESAFSTITKTDGFGHSPIVMMLPPGHRDLAPRCYQLGVKSVVEKPPNEQDFTELMETLGRFWLRDNLLPEETP